uniref:protein disulfide-isomerase n=1 Tax=Parastrongyloides trichosuri TaxID=131310 RepID=A0A0N4Z4Y3_PARTI
MRLFAKIYLFIQSILFISFLIKLTNADCNACKLLVHTFLVGLERTKKGNFAGGNTAWEEKKLGTYKTSETRFLEISENVCSVDSLEEKDRDKYGSKSQVQSKCHTVMEDNEEHVEEWFKLHQEKYPNMEDYLCIDKLKFCCPSGHYGTECKACPGLMTDGSVCFGRGTCNGDGNRKGSGKCSCDEGYVGSQCSNCASHYFEKNKSDSSLECEKCFEGCAKGCTSGGPKGCMACRTGYEMKEEGCVDIDECKTEEIKCTKANQICKNNIGSYDCVCADGYIINRKTNECELDITEKSQEEGSTNEEINKANDEKPLEKEEL